MPAAKAVKAENGGCGASDQDGLELCKGDSPQVRGQIAARARAHDKSVLRIIPVMVTSS
jgi:hypothetical protein